MSRSQDLPLPAVPLNPDTDAAASRLLGKVQANILKGHGRQFTRLLLFRFNRPRDRTNRAIFPAARRHSPKLITSAREQYDGSPRVSGLSGSELYAVSLTRAGLLACDYSDVTAGDFPPETGTNYFRAKFRREEEWESLYRDDAGEIHGLWLLAHESDARLAAMERRVETLLRSAATIVGREDGFRWADRPAADAAATPRPAVREPFGFRDGISDPTLVLPGPANGPWTQARLDRVIIADAEAGPHFGGSFQVFSKLEQNVRAFRALERSLRDTGRLPKGLRDPGALLIGRERDGTPLAEQGAGGIDDFDFDAHRRGPPASDARCPFHAHIRKSNPRTHHPVVTAMNHQVPLPDAQLVRRSVVYDQPPAGRPRQLPAYASPDYAEGDRITGHVGLLFLAYMRDIGGQFVTLRNNWSFSRTFPDPDTGQVDPLLGRWANGERWSWPARRPRVDVALPAALVRPRGELYLYAPPIPWLESPPP